MEVVTHGCENNMQEQQIVNTTTRRGRPPKNKSDSILNTTQLEVTSATNNNKELELLKSKLKQLEEENQRLKQIAETISITNTKQLINCSDEEINTLYLNYITQHETNYNNALVVEINGKVIIPKSYYVVG
jgi:hypothetical protein